MSILLVDKVSERKSRSEKENKILTALRESKGVVQKPLNKTVAKINQ